VLWGLQEGSLGGYDFTNPAEVKERPLEQPAILEKVPRSILKALGAAMGVHDAPDSPRSSP
jgi:hypothetical protein